MSEKMSDRRSTNSSMDWEAVARYLAGESPADEAEAIRRWMEAHPADAELIGTLDRTVDRVRFTPYTAIDVEAALRSVKARRDGEATPPADPHVISIADHVARKSATRTARPAPRWRIAAPAIAAAAVIGVTSLLWNREQPVDGPSPIFTAATYSTGIGARDSVRLPDGTRVVLGPVSELVVREGYGNTERLVELKGEGYFDVVHDSLRPFSVRAGSATIHDIGTSFVIRSIGKDVSVTVTQGIVALRPSAPASPADTGVLLLVGDAGTIDSIGRVAAWRNAASDDALAWTKGRLLFRGASIPEVRNELRRWYGVELVVPDARLAGRHLQADLAGETKERALAVIGMALGAEVEWLGDTAVLRPIRR
jgi:transmembrane sensor